MERDDLKNKYEQYLQAFNKYFQLLDEYNKANEQYQNETEKYQKLKDKVSVIVWVCGILGAILGISLSIIGFIIGFIIGLVIGEFIAIITHRDKKFEDAAEKYKQDVVVPLEKELDIKYQTVEAYTQDPIMVKITQDIPEDFRTLEAMEFFVKVLNNKQADTEKELYNLYTEEQHRQQMITLQQQQLETSQKSLDASKEALEKQEELVKLTHTQNKSMKKLSKQVRYGNAVNTLNFLKKK